MPTVREIAIACLTGLPSAGAEANRSVGDSEALSQWFLPRATRVCLRCPADV